MRAFVAGIVSAALAALPATSYAQSEHQPLNNLGDHVQIQGVSGKQVFTFDFQVNGFTSRKGHLFAVGTLSGGNLPAPRAVAIPVRANEREDEHGEEGSRRGGFGGFGALQPGAVTRPASLNEPHPALLSPAPALLVVPAQATQTCTVIDLMLGALHVDVLGVAVDLQPIALQVTAGAGLVGALLCAIVGIL